MQFGQYTLPYAILYLILFFGIEYVINGISYHLDQSFSTIENTNMHAWNNHRVSIRTKEQQPRSSRKKQEATVFNTKSHLDWMAQMEDKYMNTRNRINEVCQRYSKKRGMWKSGRDSLFKKHISKPNVFMFDEIHKLAFCQLPKVGTSTWMVHFLNILEMFQNMTQTEVASHVRNRHLINSNFKIPTELLDDSKTNGKGHFVDSLNRYVENNDFVTFGFVRHPFERLVSFYKSEILRNDGKAIKVFGYEKWYTNNHTFPSFITLVLDQWRKDQCYGLYSYPCLTVNPHWRPINAQCLYCDVSYNVIGSMDTFSDDVKYIFSRANLTELIDESSRVVHSSKDLQLKTDKLNETHVYFSQLNNNQVVELYKMYRIDFEMFGFETESYF